MADVKVRVEAADCGFYPDLLVTRAESDRVDRYVKRSPLLVIEVLSASTAAFDIGDKFAAYRQLDSLREYVLVDQERVRVQIYRRSDHLWLVDSVGPGERLHLDSIDLDCPRGGLRRLERTARRRIGRTGAPTGSKAGFNAPS
jgi:Uma2 family endonuclease